MVEVPTVVVTTANEGQLVEALGLLVGSARLANSDFNRCSTLILQGKIQFVT
jgi:hypothetical protein